MTSLATETQTAQLALAPTVRATAIAHHGEILQGMFEDEGGVLRRGLVTLPCPELRASAHFTLDPSGVLEVEPAGKEKARRAAALTLERCGVAAGGRLHITSDIPVQYGLGSSTSDVVAAIRAVAAALGKRLSPATIARLAVAAEVASDSTMFEERTVLFAQRDGLVLEDLGPPLPSMDVLGFNTVPSGEGISTLAFQPPQYTWQEIERFRPMLGLLRAALAAQDARLVGLVASASARANQRHLPKPGLERLERLGERVGAVGLQVAHSGTVVGLLFDARVDDKPERILAARRLLEETGVRRAWHFPCGQGGDL